MHALRMRKTKDQRSQTSTMMFARERPLLKFRLAWVAWFCTEIRYPPCDMRVGIIDFLPRCTGRCTNAAHTIMRDGIRTRRHTLNHSNRKRFLFPQRLLLDDYCWNELRYIQVFAFVECSHADFEYAIDSFVLSVAFERWFGREFWSDHRYQYAFESIWAFYSMEYVESKIDHCQTD